MPNNFAACNKPQAGPSIERAASLMPNLIGPIGSELLRRDH
jgi:hypothetical protein